MELLLKAGFDPKAVDAVLFLSVLRASIDGFFPNRERTLSKESMSALSTLLSHLRDKM